MAKVFLSPFISSPVTSVVSLTGDVEAAEIAAAVNLLTGGDRVSYDSLKDIPAVATIKTVNVESIGGGGGTLTLASEYFQFLTPTVASVIVKLPAVTGSDYFECEIANISTTNALAIQENDGTAIVTLENTGDKARSIYAFWDGTIWQVWIRGYY
jgi:hypothetical protein